jgi:DHA1 family multidrug resistance protein-like MFS transporter
LQPWQRTYWAVFVANLITAIGMMSFLPFFPSYLEELGVQDRGEIAAWAGLVFGAAPLAAAVMGPIWGSVGDRLGRKLMVVRALLAITFFVGAMGFVQTPWQLLLLRVGQGIFSGFIPPSITLVSITAPRALQGRVTGSLQAALPAGMIAGPLAGELVRSTTGSMRAVFWFVAAAAAISALLVALVAREDTSLRETLERWSPTSLLAGTWRDLRELLAKARIRAALAVLFAVQFGVGATNPQLELFVADLLQKDVDGVSAQTAWLFSSMAATGLLATPLWGRLGDRIGHARSLVRAALTTALLLAAHGFAATYAWLWISRVVLGVSSPGPNVAAFGVAATETAPERRGNAFGAVFSARALAVSLGSISGGFLASLIGIRGLFVGFAALLVVMVALVSPSLRR